MQKTWTWSTTGYGLTSKSHDEIIELCQAAGLGGIEGAPGHGLVDWNTVFRRAAEIGFSGCMCIETPPFAAGANGTYTVEAWKQMVDDTDTLVAQALRS